MPLARAPIESLNVELQNPTNHQFSYGSDHVINAVSTFPLVGAANQALVEAMKVGTALQGYRQESLEQVSDLRREFTNDLLQSDFYFPANHQTDSAEFHIGYEGGSKLVIARDDRQRGNVRFTIYLPPFDNLQHQLVIFSDRDLIEVFRRRRAMSPQRRLTVMNLACGSARCIPAWMRAYRLSLDNETFDVRRTENLQGEVPIIIGSHKSFASNNLNDLLGHSKFPFKALEIASTEGSIADLMQFLNSTNFGADTNLNKPSYFNVAAQNQNLVLEITTSAGERIVH